MVKKKKQNEIIRDLLKAFKTNEGLAKFICLYANRRRKNDSVKYTYSKTEDIIYRTRSKLSTEIKPIDYWKCLATISAIEKITTLDELRIWIDLNMYEHKDEFNLVE